MSARTVPSARPARLLARIAQLIDQRLETLAVLGRLGNNQNRIVAGKRAKHIGQLCRINGGGDAGSRARLSLDHNQIIGT